MILPAAVGSSSRTVMVQSSWLCWNRRRKLLSQRRVWGKRKESVLFLSYAVTGHTLPDLGDLGEDILTCNVSDANRAKTDSKS